MNEIIAIGLIISLIYTEITNISPGGLIVPAYFALYMSDITKILITLIISIICFGLVKLLSNFTILYGRRKFFVYVLTGIFLKAMFSFVYYENIFAFYNLSVSIGYLIPGILAKDYDKQGIIKTMVSLSINVLIIHTIGILAIGW